MVPSARAAVPPARVSRPIHFRGRCLKPSEKTALGYAAYREAFVNNQELADIYAYLVTIKPAPAAKEIPLLDFSENTRATK
jgi:hypothetical protein